MTQQLSLLEVMKGNGNLMIERMKAEFVVKKPWI